ncbi:MAG: hypothetical protein N2039_03625, partial [Gemmataceae bacterium]|nr:hypothetical protein [Gemmataceae bacterium]
GSAWAIDKSTPLLVNNGRKAPVRNWQGPITLVEAHSGAKGKTLNPSNSQKGIIAVLIGLAKQPGTSAPPAAKSAVPGPVPLKGQIEKRRQQLGVKVREGLKNHK